MRIYSVTEAVRPAWARAMQLLRTGRAGSTFKLACVVLLAEAGGVLSLPVNVVSMFQRPPAGTNAAAFHAFMAIYLGLVAVVSLVVYLAIFYFGSRMQLTQVDLVLTRSHTVAPLWARHRQTVWRWCGAKLVPSLFTNAALLAWLLVVNKASQALQAAARTPGLAPQAQLHLQKVFFLAMVRALFGGGSVALVSFALGMLLYSQMRDFVLPYLAVDQVPLGVALQRWALLWRDRTGEMLGYLFFRLLLLLGAFVLFWVLILVAIGVPVGLGFLLYFALRHTISAGGGAVLIAMLVFVFGLVALLLYLLVVFCVGAVYAAFFQCYSLYWLGGRDPRIGALLEPGEAVPVWTPPPSFPPRDDASGPDFPADPALA